jgi:cysteinyl-tRNA synthetase
MDNFNTAKAIANLSELFNKINVFITAKMPKMKEKIQTLQRFREEFGVIAGVLGIFIQSPEGFINEYKQKFLQEHGISLAEIEEKIESRTRARKNKDYETADKIRNELREQKIMLQDIPQGVDWDVSLD